MIRSNASAVVRELTRLSSVEILRRCGSALKEEIEDAFDELLEETAQFSGRTVASYRIGLGASTPDTYDKTLSIPDSAQVAFERGDQPAINLARAANAGSLPEVTLLQEMAKRKDIVVNNASPAWERVETGDPFLRAVNEASVGALKRFEKRIGDKVIDVNLGDL